MGEANFDSESIVTITGNELTLVIITSIHTLKRNKKKCGRQEVYNLVKESVEFEISSEVFTETINYLIENQLSSIHFEITYHYQKEIFRKFKLKKKISKNNFINLRMTF